MRDPGFSFGSYRGVDILHTGARAVNNMGMWNSRPLCKFIFALRIPVRVQPPAQTKSAPREFRGALSACLRRWIRNRRDYASRVTLSFTLATISRCSFTGT